MKDHWTHTLSTLVRDHRVRARMKVISLAEPSNWGWLISPVPSHLETGDLGPFPGTEIEWVEIEMTRTEHRGKLLPPATIDASEKVLEALIQLPHAIDSTRKIVRVLPSAA